MTIPKHSSVGAMSPTTQKFSDLISQAQKTLMDAVTQFERETGRTVDGISLQWIEVTQISDPEPRHIRHAHLSWLPMPGEFD